MLNCVTNNTMKRLIVFALVSFTISAARLRSAGKGIDEILKEEGADLPSTVENVNVKLPNQGVYVKSSQLDGAHWNWILSGGSGNRLIRDYMTLHKQQHKGDVPKWALENSEQGQRQEQLKDSLQAIQ